MEFYRTKVIDSRIFKITASPENFSKPKQAFWAIKIFMVVFFEKITGEFIYEHRYINLSCPDKAYFSLQKFSGEAVI